MTTNRIAFIFTIVLSLGAGPHAQAQAPDPDEGYRFLINGNYGGVGIPLSYLKRSATFSDSIPGPVKHFLSQLFGLTFPGEGMFIESDEIPGREGPNQGLSAQFNAFETKRGTLVANTNCFYCHSEKIGGQVILGLGNTTADFTKDQGKGFWLLQATAHPNERPEIDRLAGTLPQATRYSMMKTRGVNPAINLTYAYMAHRDPATLAWSDALRMDPLHAEDAPPVRVPAWWHMAKRQSMFYSGEVVGDLHRIMMLNSISGVENVKDAEALDAPFRNVEAYIRSLRAPKFPGTLDSDLASRGQQIFSQTCVTCHGTYGENGNYPETIVPIDLVGTDPALMILETGSESARFRSWEDQSYYGALTQHQLVQGYLAPPLDGVWATAPYFHNGSVPTLEGVLNSKTRPTYWTRSFDSKDYDVNLPGWRFRTLEAGQESCDSATKKSLIYDTTLPGYSNQGHTFGDSLSDSDRTAVIEYLKTL